MIFFTFVVLWKKSVIFRNEKKNLVAMFDFQCKIIYFWHIIHNETFVHIVYTIHINYIKRTPDPVN